MCTNPIRNGADVFACRTCNDCIAARKNDWVARAMAEKVTSAETIGIELTYRNNEDGTPPDAAKAFRYQDVGAFIKRLRQEYFRHYGARGELRFICAGERGSLRNRVHWHMILFGDRPFSHLGAWTDFVGKELEGPQFSELGKKAKMLQWHFWPHGHVVVKRPDQGGMQYVLKYALKDQFSSVRTKGTMRFTKSEETAASYFRMSKQPAIGMRYLERQCDRWEAKLSVPPSLHLNVPEYRGFWYPKLGLREYLRDRLYQINELCKVETGRDAPQWNTLLASVVDQEKDWEGLVYGPQQEIEDEFAAALNEEIFKHRAEQLRREQFERYTEGGRIRRQCGGPHPCRKCWAGADRDERREIFASFVYYKELYRDAARPGQSFEEWYRSHGSPNEYCRLKDAGPVKEAFDARG